MLTRTDGDNRWAAILSTDLAGFTEISQKIGSERVYALLTHVLGLARRAIEDHGGHVIDTAGDGILAAFGAPNALENASLQSCQAALAFQAMLGADRAELEQRYGVEVQFRTGIGGGNTMVARLTGGEIKVVGEPVNKAARLQALAAPGETLISETIRREAEGFLDTSDRGLIDIKGFTAQIQIHSLQSMVETATKFDGTRRRGISDLVSRDAELAQLRAALAPDKAPDIVVLRGPAGIGKSRLTHEICETDARPAFVGQCQQTGKTAAYAPFMDIFRQASGAGWGASRAQVLAPLLARYPDLDGGAGASEQSDPSRDQTEQALRMRALYRDLLHRIGADARCLFVIEDAHWLDPASSTLLSDLVADGLHILTTARPEFQPGWLGHKQVVTVDLKPLGQAAIRLIAEGHLQGALTPDLSALITEKAEGIPLMAEEVARALRQDGHLNVTPRGIAVTGDPDALLTGNLEQLVLSRVDRLPGADKKTLEHAAAIGRAFSVELLEAALGRAAGLDQIARQPGLIEQIQPGLWRFAHALIRDAIYGGLLSATRKDVHHAIATAIAASPQFRKDQSGTLAEHYLLSTEPARAAPHLVRAAGFSLAAYALSEADQQLEQARSLLDADPTVLDDETYRDMVVYWLRAMDYMGNFGRGLTISARLMPRLEAMGYSSALSISRMLTTIALAHAWQYDKARHLAETTLREANQQNDASGAAWAKVALLRILDETKAGDIATLEALFDEIQPIAAQTGDRHMAMTAYYLLSAAYRSVERHRDAQAYADKIEAFATTHNDRRAATYAAWARALIQLVKGNPDQSREIIKKASAQAVPHSGDERVCLGIEYYSASLRSAPDTYRDRIQGLADEARAMQDFNISGSLDWISALSEIRAGNLAKGWRRLEALTQAAMPSGNLNVVHQILIARVELLMSLAGLTNPEAEAAPGAETFQRKRPGLRDFAMYLRLRLNAHRLTEEAINASLTLSPISQSPHHARCTIGLGLIRAAQKKRDEARALLEEGLAKAEDQEMDTLAKRARDALAKL